MGSVRVSISLITGCYVQDKGFGKYLQRPLKKGSGYMVLKHVAYAPGNKWGQAPFIPKASLSSPSESNHARSAFLTVFHHTAFANHGFGDAFKGHAHK